MKRLAIVALGLLFLLAPVGARAADTGTAKGTVTPVQWAPEVEVCVVGAGGSGPCTVPAADGSYALTGVPLDGGRIEFLPSYRSRLLPQFYNHGSSLSAARAIQFPIGSTTVVGIDADLVEGGAISGTVSAAASAARLAEVEVCALPVASFSAVACTETDGLGAYELHSLPGGSYRVRFSGHGESRGYEPTYFPAGTSLSGATLVTVTEGVTASGVDAALGMGAQISGVVVAAADGAPVEGISVCLFTVTGTTPDRCTYSAGGGAYGFEGLPDGSYQIGFSLTPAEIGGVGAAGQDDGFQTQYYDQVSTRDQATTISLLPGSAIGGVDGVLAAPPPPQPVAPPTAVAPLVAAPVPIVEPKQVPKACGKGQRRKKVKGKSRCVKVVRHKKQRRHKPRAAGHGKGTKPRGHAGRA
jgi:hypothetical protein